MEQQNLDKIAKLNAMETAAQFGITKFADLTPSEFKARVSIS